MAVMPPLTFEDLDHEALADALMPHLLARLRGMARPEARAMADAAAEVPGLDEVALSALADWLEERQFASIAGRVRRMAVEPDGLFVIQCQHPLSPEARRSLRESWERLFVESGREAPLAVVLPHGVELSQFRTGTKEG